MSHLDAVARIAGLTDATGATHLGTDLDAVKRLLGVGARAERRKEQERATLRFGWGGYPLGDGGYDFLGLWPKPWVPDPGAGDWPYVVVLVNRPLRAVMTYIEGDVELYEYDDDEAWRAGFRAHRVAYPAP